MKAYIDKLKKIEKIIQQSVGKTLTEDKATDIYKLIFQSIMKVQELQEGAKSRFLVICGIKDGIHNYMETPWSNEDLSEWFTVVSEHKTAEEARLACKKINDGLKNNYSEAFQIIEDTKDDFTPEFIALMFFKWCNTPVFRAVGELGYRMRVQAQFPEYNTFLIIDESGYSILPTNVYLTSEQLYKYWFNNCWVQEKLKYMNNKAKKGK